MKPKTKVMLSLIMLAAMYSIRNGYDVRRVGCGHYRVTPVILSGETSG